MTRKQEEIIIVGGGLSGLTTAFLLKEKGIDAKVLEANRQLGGRIKTNTMEDGFPMELGATWIFADNPNLKALLSMLNINLHEQYQSGYGLFELQKGIQAEKFNTEQMTGGQPYHKVDGGSQVIIDKLAAPLNTENILLNAVVKSIEDTGNKLSVTTEDHLVLRADKVIICLPPLLMQHSLSFHPPLSEQAISIRKATHTWMGDSSKFTIQYPTAFWRNKNLAGIAISHVGLVREVQDHVNFDNRTFGLLGFLSAAASNFDKKTREINVSQDITRIFDDVTPHIAYQEEIWKNQPFTNPKEVNPALNAHQNNGHTLLTIPEMNGKLFFAGAETSKINPGYMEGAVRSALAVVKQMI